MLSDIFSIPFLICLAISVLLIGCSSIYFYQRIMQQDHKIASMVSLISSVTEELKGGSDMKSALQQHQQQVQQKQAQPDSSKLIVVSDGEGSESESESDSDSDSEGESTVYSDSEQEEEDSVGEYLVQEKLNHIDEEETESLQGETIDLVEEIMSSSLKIEEEEEQIISSSLNIEPVPSSSSDIKSIHLEEPLTDISLFKSIHISGLEDSANLSEDSINYKKMSLQKLREISQMQGLGDVSKLKKNEILKLLGVE